MQGGEAYRRAIYGLYGDGYGVIYQVHEASIKAAHGNFPPEMFLDKKTSRGLHVQTRNLPTPKICEGTCVHTYVQTYKVRSSNTGCL